MTQWINLNLAVVWFSVKPQREKLRSGLSDDVGLNWSKKGEIASVFRVASLSFRILSRRSNISIGTAFF
jgi:hypothetical protein